MKKKLFSCFLCLSLILMLVPSVAAATLDTADLQIKGNTVIIGSGNDAVLKALDSQGRTAKIAVPYTQAEVYVVKDNTIVVAHSWDKTGYIQFEVPGAGTYVITEGTLETLEEQLEADEENIILVSDENMLTRDHSVKDGTVIHANGNRIQSETKENTLTAEGSLKIRNINGTEEIHLGTGGSITFDAEGNVVVKPDHDRGVGYGSIQVTTQVNGKAVTRTYFLVEGEQLVISQNGKISGNHVFASGDENAKTPEYQIEYKTHDNVHVKGESGEIEARCNGLFDYYTSVTLTPAKSTKAQLLAEKKNGEDITISDVKISEGSTVLTMKSKYLNTLDTGTYTLTFRFADGGAASAALQIKQKASVPDITNPKTGD